MSSPKPFSALNEYRQVGAQSAVAVADPHRLIQMLLEGALDKLAAAKGHMTRREVEEKCHYITWTLSIIGGLRASLDMERGGEIAQNLDRLYDYMEMQLLKANLRNEPQVLDEVSGLLREIKAGWDAIAGQPKVIQPEKGVRAAQSP